MFKTFLNLRNFLLILLFFAFFMQGCAPKQRDLMLRYSAIGQWKSPSSQTIAVVNFKDLRDKKVLFDGMSPSTVTPHGQDVGAWVANAIGDELTFAGADVRRFIDSEASSNIKIVVEGAVLYTYIKKDSFNYQPAISIKVKLKKDGNVVLNSEYSTEANVFNFSLTEDKIDKFENQLEGVLKDIMKRVIPDLISAINK